MQAARKGVAVARLIRVEAQRAASSVEARLRASRTFQFARRRLRKRRAEVVALAAPGQVPPRAFDAVDWGHGRRLGGGLLYKRARQSFCRRGVSIACGDARLCAEALVHDYAPTLRSDPCTIPTEADFNAHVEEYLLWLPK